MKTIAALLCATAMLVIAPAAQAATDPLFVLTTLPGQLGQTAAPPPTGFLNGPCGLAVDLGGRIYVSDYYHHTVDAFTPTLPQSTYLGQITGVDPNDGPCGLALDSAGHLYVNDYHKDVVRYNAFSSGAAKNALPLPAEEEAQHLPTGITAGGEDRIYVDNRTYVSVYDSSGAPIEEGGQPLRIGAGSLGDGYGLAVSSYGGTFGRLYIPDASTDTVKVYDPAISRTTPAAEIKDPFGKPFASLRDSAIAVDKASGNIYFADDLQPQSTEQPLAEIYVYGPTDIYLGHLKYLAIDALPPGLAVDNSAGGGAGNVYVTSGNTNEASVYAYSSGAQTTGALLAPPNSGLQPPSASGMFSRAASASQGPSPSAQTPSQPKVTASSTTTQEEGLRLEVEGELSPKKLPREGAAPISVTVGWNIESVDGTPPPRLKSLGIEINRHGLFDFEGLPTCPVAKIQPATTQRALSNCRGSLVGQGTFSAEIALKGQEGESYEAKGRLLVFNGEEKGKPVLFGQIYAAHPFASSFVIVFKVKQLGKGEYGTSLTATLPPALRSWGNLNGIEMKLERRFSYKGEKRSFLSAGCPAPKGVGLASFKLARTSFAFNGGAALQSTVVGECKVRG